MPETNAESLARLKETMSDRDWRACGDLPTPREKWSEQSISERWLARGLPSRDPAVVDANEAVAVAVRAWHLGPLSDP